MNVADILFGLLCFGMIGFVLYRMGYELGRESMGYKDLDL